MKQFENKIFTNENNKNTFTPISSLPTAPSLNSYSESERNTPIFKEHISIVANTMEEKYPIKMDFIENSKNFLWITIKDWWEKFLSWEWILQNLNKNTKLENIFHLWQNFSILNTKTWENFNVITKEWRNWMDYFREDWKRLVLENWLKIEEYKDKTIQEIEKNDNILEENKDRKQDNLKLRNIEISEKELHNLTAIAYAEAFWDAWDKWIAAVVNVILNRSKLWGKSINQVIFEKWQFSPIADWRFKKFSKSITQKDKDLVKRILNWEIPNPIWRATFFQNKNAESSKWNWQRRANTLAHNKKVTIWNHIFRTEKKFLA